MRLIVGYHPHFIHSINKRIALHEHPGEPVRNRTARSNKPLLNWTFQRLPPSREFIHWHANRDQELRVLTPEVVAWLGHGIHARRAFDTLELCGLREKHPYNVIRMKIVSENIERRLRNDLRSV
jgi:hypothetical protein